MRERAILRYQKKLMKKDLFLENPRLMEFAKNTKDNGSAAETREEPDEQEERKPPKQELSKLKWGRPFFGIYERFPSEKGPCSKPPPVGSYFTTDEPLRVKRKGK